MSKNKLLSINAIATSVLSDADLSKHCLLLFLTYDHVRHWVCFPFLFLFAPNLKFARLYQQRQECLKFAWALLLPLCWLQCWSKTREHILVLQQSLAKSSSQSHTSCTTCPYIFYNVPIHLLYLLGTVVGASLATCARQHLWRSCVHAHNQVNHLVCCVRICVYAFDYACEWGVYHYNIIT